MATSNCTASGSGAAVALKICPLCSFKTLSVPDILSHLRGVHSHDPNFVITCGLNGCATTSRSFSALYSHIYRKHPEFINKRKPSTIMSMNQRENPGAENELQHFEPSEHTGSFDIDFLVGRDVDMMRRSSALFLLKLKEQRKMTQVAVDDVVEGSRALFSETMMRVQASVKATLSEAGVDPDSITGFSEAFDKVADPFHGLDTCCLQENYFRDKLHLVEPQEILIGPVQFVHQFSGAKRRLIEKRESYQYVPILKTLSRLLQDNSVLEEVDQCAARINKNGLIQDICDGTLFTKHPLFSKDPCALQVIAYYDELEVCNPLGSHVKKHKLGIVFFTLGNIKPHLRSKLKMINLAIAATVPVVEKYGLDVVLEPFVRDLNILATTGLKVTLCGVVRNFKGALVAFLADNLASNELGGFKKSFSFSFRCCRTCLVIHDSMSNGFVSGAFDLRTHANHANQVEMLKGPAASHYSKTYGINRKSALMNVKYYSMFGGGLPHDVMHDIFEGLAPLEIKKLLFHYVRDCRFFTLNDYNDRLLNFNYGYSDNDKPIPILSKTLYSDDKTLRSSSSQMITLVRILPFLIGDKVNRDDAHWKCFLLLRKIVDIVLSPVVSKGISASLGLLIKEHHTQFVSLYGSYIPKMHFLVHYPEQMIQVGPMTVTWVIRHEAKLNFFKKASNLVNFRNVPFSLANRHQRWMCYEMANGNIVDDVSVECGPARRMGGLSFVKDEITDVQEGLRSVVPELGGEVAVFRPTWARKHSVSYQNNNAYVIVRSDGLDPIFGCIDDILVIGGNMVFFVLSLCRTLYFDDHYHAYVVNITSNRTIVSDLYDFNVYHSHKLSDGLSYIALKYYFLS